MAGVNSAATLTVAIVVDATKAAAGMDKAAKGFGKIGGMANRMAGPATAVIGGIVAIGAASVTAASDAQQAMGGLDAVFGDNADQMKAWADTAAETAGLSEAQYAEMASGIGAQLKNLGVPLEDIGGQTNDLVKLGADLAATYGGTTEEAVSALGAALRGEADPAERFGLALNQTAIKAQMAADGTDKLTGEAAKQAKAQALLTLATEQAGGAIGQFARESDSAAGAQQVATAQVEDAKAAFGEALLPAVTLVADALGGFATLLQENMPLVQVLVGILGGMAAAILIVVAAQWAWNAAMLASPITWVIIAIAAFAVGLALLWNKSETFRAIVTGAWEAVKVAIAAVVAAAKAVGQWFVLMGARAVAIAAKIRATFSTAWNAIKSAATTAFNFVLNVVRRVLSPVIAVANAIRNTLIGAFNALKKVAGTVFNAIMAPIRTVKNLIDNVVSAVRDLVGWIGRIDFPSMPNLNPFRAAASVSPAAQLRVGARAATPRAAGGAGVVINVSGALDPEAVARQIQSILRGASVRRQGVVLAART